MPGYTIGPAGDDLSGVGVCFAAVGFRPGLVDDLATVRDLGGVILVATADDGDVVGVSSGLPFGATGWVGGVAVHPANQRHGLGERLTRQAVDALRQLGATTIMLHSTVVARPLYARIGFEPVAEYAQYAEYTGIPIGGNSFPTPGVRPGVAADLDDVLALDRWATGEDRARLLRSLWPGSGWVPDEGAARGFLVRQSPTGAGAVVAADSRTGDLLLDAALRVPWPGSPLRVAVAVDRRPVVGLLEHLGFTAKPSTTRMRLGPPLAARPRQVFSGFNLYWG